MPDQTEPDQTERDQTERDQTGHHGGPMTRTPAVHEVNREAQESRALVELKHRARAMWAAGDYPSIAERELWPLGERIIACVGVRPGEHVLDVACGSGNAAIRAAQAGGHAVGLDLTPELFHAGRRAAADAGAEVEWVEGDAEELPFDDATFDVLVSVLGAMFAPRHRVAAAELARVLRPGGRLALICWTPESGMGDVFAALARYLPAPPLFASPPILWGREEHVRSLFADAAVDLEFEHGEAHFPPFASAEDDLEYRLNRFGPLMAARAVAEADGRWPELHRDLLALHQGLTSAEYLLTVGHKH
ncbi:class I SAM-dependent methyltransferase [Streptomyces sediminimaris]|uniref:class I SAM-dependent methyltransferase n=1 Tax=Streptomyces sediminimaris TaxID=3383721 RepID=UPI00399BC4CC